MKLFPKLPDWVLKGATTFLATFVFLSFLDLYVVYVVITSNNREDIFQRADITLWVIVVAILIILYLPASLLMAILRSESILIGSVIGNTIISLASAYFVVLFVSLHSIWARTGLLILLVIAVIRLLQVSFAVSIFVLMGFGK